MKEALKGMRIASLGEDMKKIEYICVLFILK